MSTVTLGTRNGFFLSPKGIAITVVAITAGWVIMQWNLSAFVFLAIAIIFLIGINNPLWALAAILISQMTIPSYIVATPLVGISLRLILMVLALFFISGAIVRKEIDLGPRARSVIIPMIILLVITTIANIVSTMDFDLVFKYFRNTLIGLLFLILIPAILNNNRQVKIICSIILIVATCSAIVGVLQNFGIMGMERATITPAFLENIGRIPGMSQTELELAYILAAAIMVILTIFLTRGTNSGYRNLLLIPVVPMLLALYFTYTRSALFAVACGLISIIFFLRTRIKWGLIMAIIAAGILVIATTSILEDTYLGGRSQGEQESSSVARDILRQAGFAIALDNPFFGIGAGRFMEVSPSYEDSVDPELIAWEQEHYWGYTTLGNDEPHNDFIMMWLSHGTLALIVFIWFHFAVLGNLAYSYNASSNRFIKGLSVGLAAALITYVVNSFYHNTLATLPLLWILAGFSMVTAKLAAREKQIV